MDQQSLLEKILDTTTSNQGAIKGLGETVDSVQTDVSSLKEDVSGVQETVEFVKDNAAAKADVEQIVSSAKSEIITQVDGFITLHNKLETELVALHSKYERLESQLQQIAQHVKLELQ